MEAVLVRRHVLDIIVPFVFLVLCDCTDVSLAPEGYAPVTVSGSLSLTCTYSGSGIPQAAKWTLNDTAIPLTVSLSPCQRVGGNPGLPYDILRYNYSCTNMSNTLNIYSITANDLLCWNCTFDLSAGQADNTSRTCITLATTTTPTTTTTASTTTTTTTTVTSSSTSMSLATSSVTTDSTSTNPTTRNSSSSSTNSTSTSMSSTAVSLANNTNNTSKSTKPTISGSTVIATNNTSTSTKPSISGSAVFATNNTSTSTKPTISGLTVIATNNTSTSTKPTISESTVIATNNTSTSTKPTISGSAVIVTNDTSTSTKPTLSKSTTINNTASNKSKSISSDTDIKVIVPAVVVPCGLLIIEGIILVVCCVRHRTGKNVCESPDGMDIQDKSNNIDGWKQSQGHGKATDNLDAVYTTPDGFIIYPGPAAMSTARSYKDKKHHDVTDQYSRPYAGPYHHQTAYIPRTYTSTKAYTHKDKKHYGVTDQYSRPYTGTYSYQVAYVPNTYMSARTYAQRGKNYDYEGPIHQQASHLIAPNRLAYDQIAYDPQTGHYGQSSQDVYYSGGGQYSYGQRSRSHYDHSGRKQQRILQPL